MSDEINALKKEIEELAQKQQLQEEEIEDLRAEIEFLKDKLNRFGSRNDRGNIRRSFDPEENIAQLLYGPPERLRRRKSTNPEDTI